MSFGWRPSALGSPLVCSPLKPLSLASWMYSLWNFFAAISIGVGQGKGVTDLLSAMQKAYSVSNHIKQGIAAAPGGGGLMGQPISPPSLTSSPPCWPTPPTHVHTSTLPVLWISNTCQKAAKLRVSIRLATLSPPSEGPSQSRASLSPVPSLGSFLSPPVLFAVAHCPSPSS